MKFDTEMLVAIVGPTGAGKTGAAIELAGQLGAHILSVDSQQVYVGMDIGTGKEVDAGVWQVSGQWSTLVIDDVPIYGLDLTTPDKPMNVAEWRRIAWQIIAEHRQARRPLLLVGGTGLYLQSLLKNSLAMEVPRNEVLRQELQGLSADQLFVRLSEMDGQKAQELNYSDRNNPVRLVRAIEVVVWQSQAASMDDVAEVVLPKAEQLRLIGLTMERKQLYAKIDGRVDQMIEQGLVAEVEKLIGIYGVDQQAFKAIGYAQIIAYLEGKLTLEVAIERIKNRTHDYVRRQYTWFNKQQVEWIDVGQSGWSDRLNKQTHSLMKVD